MELSDKYRPRRLQQVRGQDKAVARLRDYAADGGLGGRAYWLSGKSGTGKTTLARIIANSLADDLFIEEVDADWLTATDVHRMRELWESLTWGKGGRAWIFNEAHGLSYKSVRCLLDAIEPGKIPKRCAVIFTTTNDGTALFEDEHMDASPLMTRCCRIKLTSQGLCKAFAKLAKGIARHEHLDGQPIERYERLVNDDGGSMRGALGQIQDKRMLAGE